MNIKHISWYYINQQNTKKGVDRYCPHCKANVKFIDSGKRRQNANGNTIYHYAIYKCPKDHTWNCRIEQFKSYSGLQKEDCIIKDSIDYIPVDLSHLLVDDNTIWHIHLQLEGPAIRIDKLLSVMFKAVSRNKIHEMLFQSVITLNGKSVKNSSKVRQRDIIVIKRAN